MLIIQDRIFVKIMIDGKELQGANLVDTLALIEGVAATTPSIMMVLNDHSQRLIKELCLTDGNSLVVTVGRSPEDLKTVTRQYRLFSVKNIDGQQGPRVTLIGLLDAPAYNLTKVSESYEGTTAQVMEQIAKKCQLDFDGPQAINGRQVKDSQVWLNVSKNRGAFVQQGLARFGYMDEHSAMHAALTSLGVLKYRNLMDLVNTPVEKIKYVFVNNIETGDQDESKQVYVVSTSKERSDAGMMNATQNYGSVQVTHGVTGESKIENKVDVKTSAPYLAINDQVAQTVGQAKFVYTPIDCGNTHENYERAKYQNMRQLGLFSERESLLVLEPTEVQLYDPVIYKQANADPERPSRNTDIYIVVGKTIFVKAGTQYAERIELVRMSITEKGAAALKSAEPTSVRETSVPDVTLNPSVNIASRTLGTAKGILATVKGLEDKLKNVKANALQAVATSLQTLPGLSKLGIDLNQVATNPQAAVKGLEANIRSIKNVTEQFKTMREGIEDAAAAIREGNVSLIAQNISGVARTAAFFRADGVVDNFLNNMGVVNAQQQIASVYGSVAEIAQQSRGYLQDVLQAGETVDNMVNSVTSFQDEYQRSVSGMASMYNSIIQNVSGKSPDLTVPGLSINRGNFTTLLRKSIEPASQPIYEISQQLPTIGGLKSELARSAGVTDDTRRLQWVPESGYEVPKITGDFQQNVMGISKTLNNVQRQQGDYDNEVV